MSRILLPSLVVLSSSVCDKFGPGCHLLYSAITGGFMLIQKLSSRLRSPKKKTETEGGWCLWSKIRPRCDHCMGGWGWCVKEASVNDDDFRSVGSSLDTERSSSRGSSRSTSRYWHVDSTHMPSRVSVGGISSD